MLGHHGVANTWVTAKVCVNPGTPCEHMGNSQGIGPLASWVLDWGRVQDFGGDGVLICISDQLMMAYGGPKHQQEHLLSTLASIHHEALVGSQQEDEHEDDNIHLFVRK